MAEYYCYSFCPQIIVVKKNKQGKSDLEGNQSRAFLKCLDKLEESLMRECSPSVVMNGLAYVETLRAFNQVVHTCFGVKLHRGYKESISRFSQLYSDSQSKINGGGVGDILGYSWMLELVLAE